jgi:uracil-DNA glycosylase
MEELISRLAAATIGDTFNFYRDGHRAETRRSRLLTYLRARANAPLLLVGEAAGYRGARVSGIPFTSERQLTGAGPTEATATIVRAALEELELEEDTLCWNVVPTHPGTETANRRPTRAEIESGGRFLEQLARGRRVIAVGRVAQAATGAPYVRHPSHGGAQPFRKGLLRFAAGGRRVRRLIAPCQTSVWLGLLEDEDLERKTWRDRAPLVRR